MLRGRHPPWLGSLPVKAMSSSTTPLSTGRSTWGVAWGGRQRLCMCWGAHTHTHRAQARPHASARAEGKAFVVPAASSATPRPPSCGRAAPCPPAPSPMTAPCSPARGWRTTRRLGWTGQQPAAHSACCCCRRHSRTGSRHPAPPRTAAAAPAAGRALARPAGGRWRRWARGTARALLVCVGVGAAVGWKQQQSGWGACKCRSQAQRGGKGGGAGAGWRPARTHPYARCRGLASFPALSPLAAAAASRSLLQLCGSAPQRVLFRGLGFLSHLDPSCIHSGQGSCHLHLGRVPKPPCRQPARPRAAGMSASARVRACLRAQPHCKPDARTQGTKLGLGSSSRARARVHARTHASARLPRSLPWFSARPTPASHAPQEVPKAGRGQGGKAGEGGCMRL